MLELGHHFMIFLILDDSYLICIIQNGRHEMLFLGIKSLLINLFSRFKSQICYIRGWVWFDDISDFCWLTPNLHNPRWPPWNAIFGIKSLLINIFARFKSQICYIRRWVWFDDISDFCWLTPNLHNPRWPPWNAIFGIKSLLINIFARFKSQISYVRAYG